MNTTQPEFLPAGSWYERLVSELQARGADSRELSDAVATVHTHCLEADVQPQEACGDARDYARQLRPCATISRDTIVQQASQWGFLTAAFTLPGVIPALLGRRFTMTWEVTWVSFVVLGTLLVMAGLRTVMDDNPARLITLVLALSAFALVPQLVNLSILMPQWFATAMAATALATLAAAWWFQTRHRVIDPSTGRPFTVGRNTSAWLFPVAGVVLAIWVLAMALTH